MASRSDEPGCLFCGRRAKLTAEHVLSKNIWKHIPFTGRFAVEIRKVQDDIETTERTTASNPGGLASGKLYCKRCNGGWMQNMDQSISGLVGPMINGRPQSLTPTQRYDLSVWITKLALVYESLAGSDRVVPQTNYETFWRERRPFPNNPIQLAKYTGPGFSHAFTRQGIRKYYLKEVIGLEGILINFVVGQFVAYAALPVDERRGLVVAGNDAWRTQIWPSVTLASVRWPPPHSIPDKETFVELSKPLL